MIDNNEREFQITVSQTLSKNTSVFTSNYNIEPDEDDMLSYSISEDVCLKDLYTEQHYTIPQLLKILKKECEYRMMNVQNPKKAAHYQKLIEECENWVVDDFEVVE